jgi:hypothetical protein
VIHLDETGFGSPRAADRKVPRSFKGKKVHEEGQESHAVSTLAAMTQAGDVASLTFITRGTTGASGCQQGIPTSNTRPAIRVRKHLSQVPFRQRLGHDTPSFRSGNSVRARKSGMSCGIDLRLATGHMSLVIRDFAAHHGITLGLVPLLS